MQLHLRKAMITSPRVSTVQKRSADFSACYCVDIISCTHTADHFPYKKSLHVLRHTGTNHRGTTLVPAAHASDTTSSRSLTHRHSLCLTRIHVPNYQRRACTPSPGQLQCENSYQRFLRPLAACHGHSLRRNDSELLNTFHVFAHYKPSDSPLHHMEEIKLSIVYFLTEEKSRGLLLPATLYLFLIFYV